MGSSADERARYSPADPSRASGNDCNLSTDLHESPHWNSREPEGSTLRPNPFPVSDSCITDSRGFLAPFPNLMREATAKNRFWFGLETNRQLRLIDMRLQSAERSEYCSVAPNENSQGNR